MLQKSYPNYHPVMAMAKLAHATQDERVELDCHKSIAKYVEPELKSMEVKGSIKHDHGVLRVIPSTEVIADKSQEPGALDDSSSSQDVVDGEFFPVISAESEAVD